MEDFTICEYTVCFFFLKYGDIRFRIYKLNTGSSVFVFVMHTTRVHCGPPALLITPADGAAYAILKKSCNLKKEHDSYHVTSYI